MVYTLEGGKGGVLIIILIAILEKFAHHMCFKVYFAYHYAKRELLKSHLTLDFCKICASHIDPSTTLTVLHKTDWHKNL